jgi:uncharacterized protein YqhQ
MALRNGLLIHGPTHWSAAARAADGSIEVASGLKPTAPSRLTKVPMLRGPIRLAEGFAVVPLVRMRLRSARLPMEDRGVVAAVAGTMLASNILRRRSSPSREAMVAALGLVPAVVALRNHDLSAYHGVEHKAIGAYERGYESAAEATKEHERCGSHLVAPLLGLSVAGALILEKVLERPGPIARAATSLGGVSVAVEGFAYAERNPESAFAKAFRYPGTELQRLLATREPTAEQLEVGEAALAEILRVENAAR